MRAFFATICAGTELGHICAGTELGHILLTCCRYLNGVQLDAAVSTQYEKWSQG